MAEVIVALDFDHRDPAVDLVRSLGPDTRWYKVGLELFTRTGPAIVEELVDDGKSVFLDLKFHDIPNTVAGAVRSVAGLGARMLTVHASGGAAMISAAAEAAAGKLEIVAVTILTSLSEPDAAGVFGTDVRAPGQDVSRLARLARDAGADGIVCSALEAAMARDRLGKDVTIVTPGIRLSGGQVHDQARVMTPDRAVEAGADYLVVGRAITAAEDPRTAFETVVRLAQGAEAGAA